nr:immunoglobulin heavy chain junction region [Macaca mulatta]MOW46443.1 immunoglobulin heavy chain junction region [Macaca mulatta]MOW46575.1 immunoglobulin heavy chain junction region [Macaca mulatta]MOW46795.1 immunoglobulin heavy chain junction region [Macaca mulatta]MOW46900.1 immunoglobulin heavy chain junction region [Macaca mulatta]
CVSGDYGNSLDVW